MGASVLTKKDPISDGGHGAIGAMEFGFGDGPACHTICDHVRRVGDAQRGSLGRR